ncbi:hypothetical protein ACIGXM_13720 [Kitasatospora sp. NPDC052896]|uniref:hypothetical protein n=1 Tax=Kitasatospora sp. NPDC052896 TaxID=3364061 RepID=UPI0037CAC195
MHRAAKFTGAALVSAVLISGCSGHGGSGDARPNGQAGTDGPTATSSQPSPAGAPAAGAANGDSLDGVYTARTTDGPVGLFVHRGKAAVYSDNGKRACTGTISQDEAPATLALNCADGNTDRAAGKIAPPSGGSLVVSWDSGKQDTFTRTGDASALPDPAALGGGLPTPAHLGG